MDEDKLAIRAYSSKDESKNRHALLKQLKNCPIPENQLLSNLGLFLESKNLARILFMDFLFRQIVDVQGVIVEFGTRRGRGSCTWRCGCRR